METAPQPAGTTSAPRTRDDRPAHYENWEEKHTAWLPSGEEASPDLAPAQKPQRPA